MRALIVCISVLAFGCSKKDTLREQLPPLDFRKLAMDARREQIYLLAMKHRLPPEKAEAAAWDYYDKHDIGLRFLTNDAGKQIDVLKLNAEMSKGVPDTVRSLAAKYGFEESVFAAFLFDLKVSARAQGMIRRDRGAADGVSP